MSKYNVQKVWYNTRYHPQVNHTERVNKVITTALRSYVRGNQKTWDTSLHQVAQAIRTAKHDVTEHSPAFLVFGRNVPVTGDYYGIIGENAHNIVEIEEKNHRLTDIQDTPPLYQKVCKLLKQAYDRSKQRYDLRKRPVKYSVGDRLWKRNITLSDSSKDYNAKLAPKYISCTVTKVISPLVYQLADDSGKSLGNWHVKDLKPNHTDVDSDDDPDDIDLLNFDDLSH